jgi:hypothetical protein
MTGVSTSAKPKPVAACTKAATRALMQTSASVTVCHLRCQKRK